MGLLSSKEKLLSDKLEKLAVEYIYSNGEVEKRQNVLQILQDNDCRELIGKCVDGDKFANASTYASYRNHVDLLQAFLEYGINVDVKDRNGFTALIYACGNGHKEIVRLLLNYNTNPDLRNKHGWTALMSASYQGHKEIVQLLLDHNADIDLKNNNGKTALDLARNQEIEEMIQNHVSTTYVLK